MNRSASLTLLAGALSGCSSIDAPSPVPETGLDIAEYRLKLDMADPLRMHAELDLRGMAGNERMAQARGTSFGIASQVRRPQCDGRPLVGRSDEGLWRVPDDCDVLSWDIEVASAPATGLDASLQQTVYFPRGNWWLISEPSALLRVTGAEDRARALRIELAGAETDVRGRLAAGSRRDLFVPPSNSAPEFHVVGRPASQEHEFGPLTVEYVLDDPSSVAELPLAEAHVSMLEFLLELLDTPQRLPDHDARLLVIWLGVDAARGEAGGAAGGRSFLANYIVGDDDIHAQALNTARTLMILGHEQFHQLHDLLGAGPPLPTWYGESLAQYYALRALRHGGLAESVVQRAVSHFIDPQRPVQHGLLALQTLHEQGDPEAYGMFYLQGATFWSEVDRVLRETGLPGRGLDQLAPRLVRTGGEGVGMPAALRQQLLDIGGAPMQTVLDRYL